MNWGPLRPARIDFSPTGAPVAPEFDAVYPAGASALARARQVFLGGNQLPGRWAGRRRFVVLETGFGLGHNFLATWAAWQQDARRCDRLWYVAVEKHPPQRADLVRAHAGSALPALAAALAAAWPPLTPDLHLLDFDAGRVRLLLALGDVAQVLPELVAGVDAFYLDGFAPDRNPAMWDGYRLRCLPRLAAAGATLASANTSNALRQGLGAAGFEVAPGDAAESGLTVGRFAPRFSTAAPPGRQAMAAVQRVAVVGAGLAGAAVARALVASGLAVQIFDRQAGPAGETSGNAGGLFHGIVHGHDGSHARWLRAAALHTEQVLRPLVASGQVAGGVAGLLRGERTLTPEAMQALLDHLALPADYVQVRPAALAGGGPAWAYPGGGWVSPAGLCAHWLAAPGITSHYGSAVDRLRPASAGWQLLDAAGRLMGQADAVVLCNAGDATRLLSPGAGAAPWPLRRVRGQTTQLAAGMAGLPDLPWPLADTGYALRLGDGGLLCGASAQPDDDDGRLRAEDQAHNLAQLQRLTGWAGGAAAPLAGRVGWRLQSDDRLPLLGPVPMLGPDPGTAAEASTRHRPRRLDQPRFVPRQPGLYVFIALGSRGITQAALGGELLAAWLAGDPLAAPASLLDALDPARLVARAVRKPPPGA